ncbi:MAG: DegT/DnrJ/EryC1/StrS family aminotransferase [Parvibaculaceae bacterium]|nr:DegT/DnrJ/EryC1/StrS family aminotransferase [Parvibaculaceae bacterium]HBM89909.1 DegT/DnrJ/EryC1/StrS family aminotransferase [Rhodobiaceae bacterium]|tara:strand:+ start:7845 stop:8975 length:1131 start_codon:yes stop_codon:yes gene_type:complete
MSNQPIQFIDLAAQQAKIRDKVDAGIARVLDHGQYIMGPEVKEFEQQLSDFTGATHAFGCANGTDALAVVLMAWEVGPGDAVFVPSFTYVASAEVVAMLGATPFFVDVDEATFNIDADSFAKAIGDATEQGLAPSVVVPVDLFGQPANVPEIQRIAEKHGIKILVDAAQSFGATLHNKRVGTWGHASTTSFFPAKPLGCYGDGGAIFTDDDDLAAVINSIRLHGKGSQKYDNVRIGMNSRLDTIQAAILKEKLAIFPGEVEARDRVAARYAEGLKGVARTPKLMDGATSVWAQYTLIVENRDNIQAHCKEAGVPTVVYYPMALSQQTGYKHFPSVSGGTPVSDALSGKVLSLPMHPYLGEAEQDRVIDAVAGALKG